MLFEIGEETEASTTENAAANRVPGQALHMQGPKAAAEQMFNKLTGAFSFSNTALVGTAALASAPAIDAGARRHSRLETELRDTLSQYTPDGDRFQEASQVRVRSMTMLCMPLRSCHNSAVIVRCSARRMTRAVNRCTPEESWS